MSNVVVSYIKLYMYLWGDGMHVLYDSWLDWCLPCQSEEVFINACACFVMKIYGTFRTLVTYIDMSDGTTIPQLV